MAVPIEMHARQTGKPTCTPKRAPPRRLKRGEPGRARACLPTAVQGAMEVGIRRRNVRGGREGGERGREGQRRERGHGGWLGMRIVRGPEGTMGLVTWGHTEV